MLRKNLSCLVAIAVLALSASVHAMAKPDEPRATSHTHEATVGAWSFQVADVAPVTLADLVEAEAVAQVQHAVVLRRAGQYAVRALQRERPEVTPDWRRCPSV